MYRPAMSDPTTHTPADAEFDLERFWRRLRPNLRLAPPRNEAPAITTSGAAVLPDAPRWGTALVPTDAEGLYVSREYLESLPTRPLDHARRVRFERHVGGSAPRLLGAEQVLFPRATPLRRFENPVGLLFGRPGVDPSYVNADPERSAWQHRHLGLHLASFWVGAATIAPDLIIWSQHQPLIITMQRRRRTAVFHASIGFAAEPRGLPAHWYSWVPASRPFVVKHSLRDLVGGHSFQGGPMIAVYLVMLPGFR